MNNYSSHTLIDNVFIIFRIQDMKNIQHAHIFATLTKLIKTILENHLDFPQQRRISNNCIFTSIIIS